MYLLRHVDALRAPWPFHAIPQGWTTEEHDMLGPYPMAIQGKVGMHRPQTELGRYVRWEYGSQATVASFLAQAAEEPRKARTKRPGRLAEGVRALRQALRSLADARRSKAGRTEG